VIGAFAYPGNCLNLTDYGVMNELALAYEATLGISAAAGTPLPVNSVRENGQEAYDTVYGVFEEGELVYPGVGFRDRTHLQITICNPEIILGYFRVDGMT